MAKLPVPHPRPSWALDEAPSFSLEDAGFDRQPPAQTFSVTIDGSLRAADGQTLGYTWAGSVENWHERAFTSFGDGHGVWERGGGLQLPFYARNMRGITQWAQRVPLPDLVPMVVRLQPDTMEGGFRQFSETPPSPGQTRRLNVTPDRIQSHGLDLSPALGSSDTGLVWAAIAKAIRSNARSALSDSDDVETRATIVQVTNLGITVKDSPQNTLVFVTRLDTAAPVPAARVSIVNLEESDGVERHHRRRRRRDRARKRPPCATPSGGGSCPSSSPQKRTATSPMSAATGTKASRPGTSASHFDLNQAQPMLRGTVFTDRGVYRLGEEVHFKAILRHNTPQGIRLLRAGTACCSRCATVRIG